MFSEGEVLGRGAYGECLEIKGYKQDLLEWGDEVLHWEDVCLFDA